MLKEKAVSLNDIKEKVIIVAHDLAPSQTASLPKDKILGFITDVGGKTSHTAIIARSLRIPAVVGLEVATENIKQGDKVIVDGSAGQVVVKPTDKTIKDYQKRSSIYSKEIKAIHIQKDTKACTKDGKEVLNMNVSKEDYDPLKQKIKLKKTIKDQERKLKAIKKKKIKKKPKKSKKK